MSFVSKTLLAAAVAVGFTASAATAATIDFEESTGGTVSYGGADGVDNLVGSGIGFGTVTIGTEAYTCEGCVLTFETDASSIETPSYIFLVGTSSFVTLTGTIKDDTDTVVSSGTLFSGDFGSTVVGFVTGSFATFGMGGTGTIDADLATEAGTGVVAEFGLTVLSVGVATGLSADGSFSVDLTDADFDLVLASPVAPIPLPAPLAMLLLGVAGIGFAARRRA